MSRSTPLERMTILRGMLLSLETGFGKPEPIDIDDCTETYGDNIVEIYPDESELCFHPRNPSHQHVYGRKGYDRHCIYCERRQG